MDQGNLLQMLLLRGLGTTSLVTDRLRYVTQEWVRSGRLDPSHASALVEDVLRELEQTRAGELLERGLHEYVDRFQTRLNEIGGAVAETFFRLNVSVP